MDIVIGIVIMAFLFGIGFLFKGKKRANTYNDVDWDDNQDWDTNNDTDDFDDGGDFDD